MIPIGRLFDRGDAIEKENQQFVASPRNTSLNQMAQGKSRWLLLKRSESLRDEQHFRLRDLLRYNLKTVRAYLLKEAFQ